MNCKRPFFISLLVICLCFLLLPFSTPQSQAAATGLLSINSVAKEVNQDPTPVQAPLTESPEAGAEKETDITSFLSKKSLVHLQIYIESFTIGAYWRVSILMINSVRLFHDIGATLNSLAALSGFSGTAQMLRFLIMVFSLAILLEWLLRLTLLRRYLHRPAMCPLTLSYHIRMTISRAIPEMVSLAFFCGFCYGLYILIYSPFFSVICPAFLSVLIAIILIRLFTIGSSIYLSPTDEALRYPHVNDRTARFVHRSVTLFFTIIVVGVMTTSLLKHGGLEGDSLLWVKLFFGTTFIVITGVVVFLNRVTIADWIHGDSTPYAPGRENLAPRSYTWLSLLIFYLFLLWLLWCGKLILSESQLTLAFTASLLVVPVFLLLDGLIARLFGVVTQSLAGEETTTSTETSPVTTQNDPGTLTSYLRSLSRLVLLAFLLLGLLSLWGIHFSFTSLIVSAMVKIALIFLVFFVIWQLIAKSISNYLAQKDKSQHTEEEDDGGGEWGGGQLLDRSQTLLPIVRKFLGIIMLVMLALFTLSSLGVNIGPLLAGAGVMGIAIGFGAQKLVSDLFSGFFYLIDDAFRVGEYIEAGNISGTVEKITLRNLMLRHHRGMLQIIPYSDLGAITNFMRGGIVVKFDLQFPYDTNVDLVRKVIKRVGIEMLEDPAFGKNFISQVKSQGIREVGDSVLTIRAKFTAKPGTHFLIRREAYRRITEALNDKDIYYAHRKVIVDFPEAKDKEITDQQAKEHLLKAGAAAALMDGQGNEQAGDSIEG